MTIFDYKVVLKETGLAKLWKACWREEQFTIRGSYEIQFMGEYSVIGLLLTLKKEVLAPLLAKVLVY